MIPIYIELDKVCERCKWRFSVGGLSDIVMCPSCGHENPLGHRWRTAFESVLSNVSALPSGTPQLLGWMTDPQEIRWGSEPPKCHDCGVPLPLPSLGTSEELDAPYRGDPAPDEQQYPCPGCGLAYRIRRTPPEIEGLLPGVTHLIGERKTPPRPPPVSVSCPYCHGALDADGTKRTLLCVRCLRSSDVPDAIWGQLLSAKKTIRWYLLYQAEQLANTPSEDVVAATVDASGNLYFLGTRPRRRSGGMFLWSCDASLRERWVTELEEVRGAPSVAKGPEAQLLFAPNGELYVRHRRRHPLSRYSSGTGELLGTLGGRETAEASVHQLDLEDCTALACDPDGTLLACIHERLLRFDANGVGIPTWPARTGISGWLLRDPAPAPLYTYAAGGARRARRGPDVSPSSMGSRPHEMDDRARMCFGPEQTLYVIVSDWVYAYDRSGKQLLKKNINNVLDLGVHPSGQVYLLRRGDGLALYRMDARGGELALLQRDQRLGGGLGPEERLLVCPEAIWLVGDDGQLRSVGIDGRVLTVSDVSRAKDEERRRARERGSSS